MYTHMNTVEYYSTMRKNKILIFVQIGLKLGDIILY